MKAATPENGSRPPEGGSTTGLTINGFGPRDGDGPVRSAELVRAG